MNDKTRIKNTFKDLRKMGNKIVFDHNFNREGNIDSALSLRWEGEAAIIVSHAEDAIHSRFTIDNVVCEAYLAKIIRSVNEKKIRKCLTM